ncbi:MAG: serine hydrolase, partial [Acidobacteriaceae bacterium]|nr:serine hydrolase [Acidobacteriaceae bacterium]
MLCACSKLAGAGKNHVLEQKVDAIFAAYENPGSPGCAIGIVENGDFIYKRGYAIGSLELQVPLSPESVFYMGSVSKQFTAASVVLAAEQGYLSLDDDLHKWIPEIPSYGHPITLREMLHHTSGLRDEIGLMTLAGDPVENIHTTQEIIQLIARQKKLNFNPGDEYQYSNSNYFLLAEIVHRATRVPFSQFADENIFQRLGMVHTRFYDDRTLVLPGRVPGYSA